ncbi:MAG: restriction endonuclease, partial [Halobacteriaceae archaeon]
KGSYAFYLHEIEDLRDQERVIKLSTDDIKLLNPNTKTCPVFETREEAELTIKIYRQVGVLNDYSESGDSWGAELTRIFNTSDDSDLFYTKEELLKEGWELKGNKFKKNGRSYFPLYEAKLVYQYDHRFATFEGVDQDEAENGNAIEMDNDLKDDPNKYTIPRYWIHEKHLEDKNGADWNVGLRDITNATNERTVISSAIPKAPTVNSLNLIKGVSAEQALILMACFNSYTLDFVARQKLSSARLGHYVVRQLPVPDPNYLEKISYDGLSVREVIEKASLALTYTAHDLDGLVQDSNLSPDVYSFNQPNGQEREDVRFELEAILCHVYGIEESDFEILFNTFNQIKERDIEEHGYYRTRDKIKKRYKEMSDEIVINGEDTR